MFLNAQPRTRVNNTTKSSIAFDSSNNDQQYDFGSQGVRQRQF